MSHRNGGKADGRMLQDAAIIATRLQPLSESGASAASLEALVREKSMPRLAVGAAMRGLLRKTSNGSTVPLEEGRATPMSNGEESEGPVAAERSGGEEEEKSLNVTAEAGEGKEAEREGTGAEDKEIEEASERKEGSPSKGWREVGAGDANDLPAPPPKSPSPPPPPTSKSPADDELVVPTLEGEESASASAGEDAPPPPPKSPSPTSDERKSSEAPAEPIEEAGSPPPSPPPKEPATPPANEERKAETITEDTNA